MKIKSGRLMMAVVFALSTVLAHAQSGPTLNIGVQSANSVQLNWASQSGTQ